MNDFASKVHLGMDTLDEKGFWESFVSREHLGFRLHEAQNARQPPRYLGYIQLIDSLDVLGTLN